MAEAGSAPVAISWEPRVVPLAPTAIVAENRAVAAALLRRLLALTDQELGRFAGLVTDGGVVAISLLGGGGGVLPWADGVRFLGRDPDAGALLLPTNLGPSVPTALFARALPCRAEGVCEPVAVWPADDGLSVLSLSEARRLDRAVLETALHELSAGEVSA